MSPGKPARRTTLYLASAGLALGAFLSTMPSASAADDLIAPGSAQRQLISLGHSNVLEWVPASGGYRIWKYDRTQAGDPFPGAALVTGSWGTIGQGHQLIYLGAPGTTGRVLDWEPFTGHYRVWSYDPALVGNVDPFPGSPLAEGTWGTIRTGHQLIYLDGQRMLDWEPATGSYRVWGINPVAVGAQDPLPGPAISIGVWSSVRTGERLIYLGNDRVLAFHASTGDYRIWPYFRNPPSSTTDPLPSPTTNQGHWNSIGVGHELISVESDRVLDWQRATGFVRSYRYDIAAQAPSDPLPAPATSTYTWSTIRSAMPVVATQSSIHRVVLIVQENHSFDTYFGRYCTAQTGSLPFCTTGKACCEAAPYLEPMGHVATRLDDAENAAYSPIHLFDCEVSEINGGLMDRFAFSPVVNSCSDPRNFAYSWDEGFGKLAVPALATYWGYAQSYAMADHYFQPVAGSSYDNDVYFAKAGYVAQDNILGPSQAGVAHIGSLLANNGVSWASYLENTSTQNDARDDPFYPFDHPVFADPNLTWSRPFAQLADDLQAGTLPRFSIVKATDARSEHPGRPITDGVTFVSGVINAVLASQYANDTLILFTYDECGGFYDHIKPPPDWSTGVDSRPSGGQLATVPYGPRIPFLAIGHFVKVNYISHTVMEHSSVVRFLEWNYNGGVMGQLGRRDTVVNGIGSLLDSNLTGVPVPQ